MNFTKEIFESFRDHVLKTARGCFEQHGQVNPMAVILVTKNPETGEDLEEPALGIVPGFFDNDREKDMWVGAIADICKKSKAVALAIVNEAWIAVLTKEEAERGDHPRPMNHPNRKEAVIVMMECPKFGSGMYQAMIERDSEGKGTVQDFDIDNKLTKVSGRFANVLNSQVN